MPNVFNAEAAGCHNLSSSPSLMTHADITKSPHNVHIRQRAGDSAADLAVRRQDSSIPVILIPIRCISNPKPTRLSLIQTHTALDVSLVTSSTQSGKMTKETAVPNGLAHLTETRPAAGGEAAPIADASEPPLWPDMISTTTRLHVGHR